MPYRTYPDGTREEISMEEFQRELANATGPITVTPVIRNPDGTYRKDTFWERLEAEAAEQERAYRREKAREQRLQAEYEREQRNAAIAAQKAKEQAEKERLFREKVKENGIDEQDWGKYRIYLDAQQCMTQGRKSSFVEAERMFRSIPGWMDADSLANTCVLRIKEFEEQEEKARLRREEEERKASRYKEAKGLIDGNYYEADKCKEAIAIFTELGDYSDSASQVKKCKKQLTEINNRNVEIVMEKIRAFLIVGTILFIVIYALLNC